MLGAGLALAEAAGSLEGRVRLVFQPAEELMPGGALDVLADGWLEGVSAVFGLHCDPALEVGRVGLKSGAITAAADVLQVRLTGPGGHTSRPHNTVDLVHVLSTVATGLPDALGRLVDPRAGLCLVWGHVSAGVAHNAIPRTGVLKGTLRVLDKSAWHGAPAMVQRIVDGLVAPYGAHAEVRLRARRAAGRQRAVRDGAHDGGRPLGARAAARRCRRRSRSAARTSPGTSTTSPARWPASASSRPARSTPHDLHQGSFDVDEAALPVAVRVLVATALAALSAA